jgi:acyl dehydratase
LREFFEDLRPGRVFETGGLTLTEDAIMRFALEWDFQPFHVDREAAKSSMFGQIIASGLHTLAATFRICVESGLFTGNAVVGLGYDAIRFLRPVPAGTTLRVKVTVLNCRPSASRPELGVVRWGIEARNERGDTVLTMKLSNMVRRRPTVPDMP